MYAKISCEVVSFDLTQVIPLMFLILNVQVTSTVNYRDV